MIDATRIFFVIVATLAFIGVSLVVEALCTKQ